MDHTGIDVHKKESKICILAEGGELLENRIRTEPARFATVLGARPPRRIVRETSTKFTDKVEVARVRDNLLKEKRGLTHTDAQLDAAIAAVSEAMKTAKAKDRVTVYYVLAERFGKLSTFV